MPISRNVVVQYAIRSAFLSWGHAWMKIDPETREAYLMLAIVHLLSGHCRPYPTTEEWMKMLEQPWTVKDCMCALETCKHWCHSTKHGMYGPELIRMAVEDEADPNDPIKKLTEHFHKIYGT